MDEPQPLVAANSLTLAAWKSSRSRHFTRSYNTHLRFCPKGSSNPLSPTLNEILNFLVDSHAMEELAYRTINCYRSSLSQVLPNYNGYKLGKHPVVSRLLKDIFNANHTGPHYTNMWQADTVSAFLNSLGPNESTSLKDITYKLAMLLPPYTSM